ncbi:hypothetical protein Q4Q34_15435 [Flavivirga abyssicola]|uniref:hypothetical protein n=1 Tax=Flavivirga abyssicola TaxID=3063533 RepID=UPI0026DF3A46|nr:hypothetical protein [Flavivirga sp. MEBiC07777]WVK12609.1 hypothetical protein Q4Q34_15435 [Flavivirga sp. MEBiC07777]
MKNVILIITFLFTSINISGQQKRGSKIDELIEITDLDNTISTFVNSILDKHKEANTSISDHCWEKVKSEIDYEPLLDKIRGVYKTNFTEEELTGLFNLYKSGNINEYERQINKIDNQLYIVGNEFGKNTSKIISEKINNCR